jgi:nucleotide-binding universal stress UspA family protein
MMMNGTVVCAVRDGAQNDDAVAQAVAVSEQLGLRLVLAYVADGVATPGNGDGTASANGDRQAAERRLAELADAHGIGESAERRVEVGDPARLLGQIAGEEAADVIVVGAQASRWGRRRLKGKLVQQLETLRPVPVLIAPPRNGAEGSYYERQKERAFRSYV